MKRKIVVSSNCQTGGVASALAAILPSDRVVPVPLPAIHNETATKKLIEILEGADLWVSTGRYELASSQQLGHLAAPARVIRFPEIAFSAFHPDLVYARRADTNELISPHYNSAIAIWAYRHSLPVEKAVLLFSESIFEQLGYLESWDASVSRLEERFRSTDLDFWTFFLRVKRTGVFMHTINHPLPPVMIRLAMQIALRLDAPRVVLDAPIQITDGLLATIWPLYPPIASRMGLQGSWNWKVDGNYYAGVRSYLDFSYARYRELNLAPAGIQMTEKQRVDLLDRVLGPASGVGA